MNEGFGFVLFDSSVSAAKPPITAAHRLCLCVDRFRSLSVFSILGQLRRYTADHRMSDASPRNWTTTYAAVIAVEIVVLLALWWLQQHFRI